MFDLKRIDIAAKILSKTNTLLIIKNISGATVKI